MRLCRSGTSSVCAKSLAPHNKYVFQLFGFSKKCELVKIRMCIHFHSYLVDYFDHCENVWNADNELRMALSNQKYKRYLSLNRKKQIICFIVYVCILSMYN